LIWTRPSAVVVFTMFENVALSMRPTLFKPLSWPTV